MSRAIAQQSFMQQPAEIKLQGKVSDSLGRTVSGARVTLEDGGAAPTRQTVTDASGRFQLIAPRNDPSTVSAEKAGLRSQVVHLPAADPSRLDLVLVLAALPPAGRAMDFSDQPDFKIAGVTDWTAVGGHGSDAELRTSEDLARQTLTLKPRDAASDISGVGSGRIDGELERHLRAALIADPRGYAANHQLGEYYLLAARYPLAIPLLKTASAINHEQAEDEYDLALGCRGVGDLKHAQQHVQQALAQKDAAQFHRLAGDIDEKLDDPLAAVQQDELAARLDPSEENYFAWGSELLLHRAVWQAVNIFRSGAKAHPHSSRMLTALGTALFAGALYDEAAQRLCEASDLNPADPEPYMFMGKIELASPTLLPCVEQRLQRFVRVQPESAKAHYLYAMSLTRRETKPDLARVEYLLIQAITLDPKYVEAYLQLGIISATQHDYSKAIGFYTKAIAIDPELGEAHYRLAVAYDRAGESAKAAHEFQIHDELERTQADAVEEQRRAVKQFLVVLQRQPAYAGKP